MSDSFLGEIRLWSAAKIPTDWAACNGQTLSVATYEALFSLLGTKYGGDGVNTFGVPNLQGALPIGQGQGPGLTARVMAQTVGTTTVTLAQSELPAHNHPLQAVSAAASSATPGETTVLAAPTDNLYSAVATPAVALNNVAVSPSGPAATGAHNNLMPYCALQYIISLVGVYPQPA